MTPYPWGCLFFQKKDHSNEVDAEAVRGKEKQKTRDTEEIWMHTKAF